jgi:hypothetical protein
MTAREDVFPALLLSDGYATWAVATCCFLYCCCLLFMLALTCQMPLLLLFLLLSLAIVNHVFVSIVHLHSTMPAPTVGVIPDRLLQFLHVPVFSSCSFPQACLPCSRHTAAVQIIHSQTMVARLTELIHWLTELIH